MPSEPNHSIRHYDGRVKLKCNDNLLYTNKNDFEQRQSVSLDFFLLYWYLIYLYFISTYNKLAFLEL